MPKHAQCARFGGALINLLHSNQDLNRTAKVVALIKKSLMQVGTKSLEKKRMKYEMKKDRTKKMYGGHMRDKKGMGGDMRKRYNEGGKAMKKAMRTCEPN